MCRHESLTVTLPISPLKWTEYYTRFNVLKLLIKKSYIPSMTIPAVWKDEDFKAHSQNCEKRLLAS